MGNEASSVRIHEALTAEDIKGLRAAFPGAGNGPAPGSLDFGPWKSCWRDRDRAKIEGILTGAGQRPEITFHAYQELAGNCVRGTTEDRVKLIFRLLDKSSSEKKIKAEDFLEFAARIVETASNVLSSNASSASASSSRLLAESLMHEFFFPNESAKSCWDKKVPEEVQPLDFDAIERWLVMKCPLFEQIFLFTLASSFGISVQDSSGQSPRKPPLTPTQGLHPLSGSTQSGLTAPQVMFLNYNLPGAEFRSKWRPLFNSRVDGENFSKLSSSIMSKGPTLIVVWEENEGNIFGGFASDSWRIGPKFYGGNSCFLFSLKPKMHVYESTSFNANYMYFNLKQKTMVNGLGMGGQMPDFFGLWLDSEYGKGKCAPSCSSYQSPRLSKFGEDFKYSRLEVWGVGEEPKVDPEDEEGCRSALDADPEAQAMMEMMGKTFVSKDVRAADEQSEKEKNQ